MVEIAQALVQQQVSMEVLGIAPGVTSSIRLDLTNLTPGALDVSVGRGTSFVPRTDGYQTMVARIDYTGSIGAGPGTVESFVIPTICGSQFGVAPPPVDGSVRYDTPGVSGLYVPFFQAVDGLTDTFIPMAGSVGMPVDMFKDSVLQYTVWKAFEPLAVTGPPFALFGGLADGPRTGEESPKIGAFDQSTIYDILLPQLTERGASDDQVNQIATTLWEGVDTTMKTLREQKPEIFDEILEDSGPRVANGIAADFSGSNSAGVRTMERGRGPGPDPVIDERTMPAPGDADVVIAQPDLDDLTAHYFGRSIAWDTLEHEAEQYDWVYDYEEFERLGYAIGALGQDGDIGQEAWDDIKAMLTPTTVALIAIGIFFPPIALALTAKGFLDDAMLLAEALNGIITAEDKPALDAAAKNFEKVLVKIGIGALTAILMIAGGKAVQAAKNKYKSKSPPETPALEPVGNAPAQNTPGGKGAAKAPEPFELMPEGTFKGPQQMPQPNQILANGKARPPVNSKGVFPQSHPFTCAIAQIRTVLRDLGMKVPSEFALFSHFSSKGKFHAKGMKLPNIAEMLNELLAGTGKKATMQKVTPVELNKLVNTPGTKVIGGVKTLAGGRHMVGYEGIKGGQVSIAESGSGASVQLSGKDFVNNHWMGDANGKAWVIVID